MRYGAGASADAEWLKAIAEEEGKPFEIIPDAPKLSLVEWSFWEVFCCGSRSRQIGGFGGPQPLSLTDMRALFEIFRISADDVPDYVYVLQELDKVWLAKAIKSEDK